MFNLKEALEQLKESGGKLVDLSKEVKPFPGISRDDRWPRILVYYTSIRYLNCDPLDEFIMLGEQLIKISGGNEADKAKAELDKALALITEEKRRKAGRHAVRSYQTLFFHP